MEGTRVCLFSVHALIRSQDSGGDPPSPKGYGETRRRLQVRFDFANTMQILDLSNA